MKSRVILEGDIQHLNQSKCSQTETTAQDGEEAIEEARRKAEFGEDEDYSLEDDEQPVQDGPKCARRLIGHCAPANKDKEL